MSSKNQQKQLIKTKKIVKDNKPTHNAPNKKINSPAIIKDKRFESAQYDPKFAPPKINVGKVKIDKRFADKLESEKFKISAATDKYGRKNKDNTKLAGMSDYYYTQDQQQNQLNTKKKNVKKGKDFKKTYQQDNNIDQQIDSEQKHENNISKWMKQYDQQSSSDMEEQEDNLVQQSDSVWSDDKQNVIKSQNVQVTNRLALCNYDWMNIGSKDLMLLFSSFKPTSGTILSVTVYYSQLGKEKMEAEEKFGPQGIWNQQQQENEQDMNQNKRKNRNLSQLPKSKRQQQAFNHKKLRAYEKQRLKYCYAIIECNSKKTADQIYKQCDGNQFQNSNILFDLRFVPDSIQFDPSMLKQKCDQIPVSGEVKNFVSRALGHSKVSLTWQDPQLNSIASLKNKNWNKMSDKQMDNIDWGLYLNEQVQQANDNMNKILKKDKKQKQALNSQQNSVKVQKNTDWRSQCNKKNRKNTQQDDLQIVFPSGFDNKIQTKKQKESLNKQLKTRRQRWRHIQEQKKSRQQIQLLVEPSDKKQFKYNPDDERFKAVLENPEYYIDPSNPKFDHRKTGAVFEEVVKHNKKKNLL